MLLGNLKQKYSKWEQVWEDWTKKESNWMRIDSLRQNNEVDENTEYSLLETIKGWMHNGMIRDLTIFESGLESKKGVILIIMRSFKAVINQVWVNRCKRFVEWEFTQRITREQKSKKNFVSMWKTCTIDYEGKKSSLALKIDKQFHKYTRSYLISVNNFSLVIFGYDNGGD